MVKYILLITLQSHSQKTKKTMSEFCNMCDNLLSPVFYNDELNFKCLSCNIIYPSNEIQSLRFERIKGNDAHDGIMENAVEDPATMKALISCIQNKCKGGVVKQIRVGKNMHLYNICTTCKTSWLYQG